METFHQFQYSRKSTTIALTNIDEKDWDVQPNGYPNTIRWNAGHIYVTVEEYLNKADNNYVITHPEWFSLFIDGTRPSDWDGDIPSKDMIITALEEQEKRILSHFEGKLKNKASEVQQIHALTIDTPDAALQFLTWHEGLHLGIIKSLKLAVQLG